MTMTADQPATARQIHHPDWCGGGAPFTICEVDRDGDNFVQGDHRGLSNRIRTSYGPTLAVGLMANVRDENNPKIELRIPGLCADEGLAVECEHGPDDNDHYTFAGTAQLEPEEAMMLARRLTEAVADWHAARRNHPTSR